MSGDGPTKVEAALDDIILGEDGLGPEPGPAPPTPLDEPPPKKPSGRPKAAEGEKDRKRAKMTLRIPDDEVSRPNLPPGTPPGGVAAVAQAVRPPSSPDAGPGALPQAVPGGAPGAPTTLTARAPVSPDDTVEIPPQRGPASVPPSPGVDTEHEPGWTPYEPPVVERRTDPDVTRQASDPPGPHSEEIPIDTDLASEDVVPVAAPSLSEAVTSPRLPSTEGGTRRNAQGDRTSDVGELPEIELDDVVSVESLPSPALAQTPVTPRVSGSPPAPPVATIISPPAAHPAVAPVAVAPAVTPVAVAPAVAPPAPSAPQPPPAPPVSSAPQPPPAPPAPRAKADSVPPAGELKPPPVPPTPPKAPSAPPPRQQQAHLIVPSGGALAPPPLSESSIGRKKARPWWEELFNDDFVRTMAKITPAAIEREVDFIEESLGCESGAMILDLGCGTGEHCVSLSKRGYQVVGFDLSLSMLARAADEAQESNQKLNFVQGDMRDMTFEETFDGVYSWNTSFGFFDEEKNAQVVERVRRSLKKGGQFLLDVANRDYVIRQAPSLAWYEGDGCICMDEMTVDFITSRMKVKRTLMLDDGRTKEIEYSIRLYSLHELGKLLHDNGFRVAEVSGRTATPGVFFGCESPRTLILAEKR